MDDIRSSFSRIKKGLKHRLRGKKVSPDRPGDKAAGERVDSSASLLQSDPRAAASSHDENRSGINTDVLQARSSDPPPQPEPMPTDEGRGDPKGKETDVDGKEASRGHSRLGPDVEVAAGSGPSREVQQASSPLSFTSIPRKQEPDSTLLLYPQLQCLIIPLCNADTSTVPDHMPQDLHPNENAEPSAAANEKGSSWKSTAFAAAKLLLRGVRDSADAFGPLKSVAGGLCFILENSEV